MSIDTTALRALLALVKHPSGTRLQVGDSLEETADLLDSLNAGSLDLILQSLAVDDLAYDATSWNGSLLVPTRNAVRDKIESFNLSTGTYTPTLTNTTNITSSTALLLRWIRINNAVAVFGRVNFVPTVAGACTLRLSLPISNNNFAVTSEAGGVGTANRATSTFGSFAIAAIASTQLVSFTGWASYTTNTEHGLAFLYEIV
jgi:hypothetical protein